MHKIKILLLVFSLVLISGCTLNLDKDVASVSEVVTDEEKVEVTNVIDSIGSTSSVSSPLSINSWGIASKYNAYLGEYKTVDVSITKVYNDSEISDEIASYNELNSDNPLEVNNGFKFVVLEYDVIFYDFETESFGTSVSLDVEITDVNGDSFVVDGVKQVITVTTINESTGVVSGGSGTAKIAFQIPNDADSYLVKLGTYDKTVAYYKI